MASKQMLLDSILHEVEVVKFLSTKVPADGLDYRPTPGQRSTLELLQYLSDCGYDIAIYVLDPEGREGRVDETGKVTLDNFAESMDLMVARMRELFARTPDAEFETRTVTLPWGGETTVDGLFLNATLKFLVGYRMQLFLYLKSMGVEGLGTLQCWRGVDG